MNIDKALDFINELRDKPPWYSHQDLDVEIAEFFEKHIKKSPYCNGCPEFPYSLCEMCYGHNMEE